MTSGRFDIRHQLSAAQPEPSALTAAWVNSFWNRSKPPNSLSMAAPRTPAGFPPPPLPAGARFSQKRPCSRCPPMWKDSSLRAAFMSSSPPAFRACSSFSNSALAPVT